MRRDSISILRKRFVLFFIVFAVILTALVTVVSIQTLESAFDRFREAENKEFVSVLADRLITKTIVSYVFLVVIISAVIIPLSLILFNIMSEVYLKYFEKITKLILNKEKSFSGREEPVQKQLEHLLNVVIQDQKKLREYEKMNSWKDGVRMLLHELKNPLTPLKLTTQGLMFEESNDSIMPEIISINESVTDIERVIRIFQQIVNIKFDIPEKMDIVNFLKTYIQQNEMQYDSDMFDLDIDSEVILVTGEQILLKMLFNNLINNGLEANKSGFSVKVKEKEKDVQIKFVTLDVQIESTGTIFKPGVSGKGDGRGYGLFLCKLISEYLNLNISVENTDSNVEFTINMTKIKE